MPTKVNKKNRIKVSEKYIKMYFIIGQIMDHIYYVSFCKFYFLKMITVDKTRKGKKNISFIFKL